MTQDLRILVVDDRQVNRLVLSEIFTQLGGCVSVAEDGAQALAMAEVDHYDLICLDRQMPGLHGDQVAERLAAEQFVLAWASDLSGLPSRFNGVLPKPISIAAARVAMDRARDWRRRAYTRGAPAAHIAQAA
jgi:CheY-like chemotaxis protein